MLGHLTTTHKELDAVKCQTLCEERIALYQELLGTPLQREEVTPGYREGDVWDRLPTISVSGYECNWCDVRHFSRTRDDFLRHVIQEHPKLDLDEVEQRVPNKPQRTLRRRAPPKSPIERIQGVETVKAAPVKPLKSFYNPTSISIPRNLSAPSISSSRNETSGTGSLEFNEANFPCELCGKSFGAELTLLQHLLDKHIDTPTSHSSGVQEVAQFTREEALQEKRMPGTPPMHLTCELCPSTSVKVYNLPSALFSHFRFKHPAEDAAYYVERAIAKSKSNPVFSCPHCLKPYASQKALSNHIQDKHAAVDRSNRTDSSKDQWWCNACEKGFTTSSALLNHRSSKHQYLSEPYPCPACKRVLTDRFSLHSHITQSHPTLNASDVVSDTPIECEKCQKKFIDLEGLHVHEVKHHQKDPRLPVKPVVGADIVGQAVARQARRAAPRPR